MAVKLGQYLKQTQNLITAGNQITNINPLGNV